MGDFWRGFGTATDAVQSLAIDTNTNRLFIGKNILNK